MFLKIFFPEINKEAWELLAESYSLGDIAEFVGNARLCNLGIHLNFKPFMTINSIFQDMRKAYSCSLYMHAFSNCIE